MMKFLVPIALTLAFVASLEAAACAPPTLPPGSRWVPNEGCTSGPTYTSTSPPREKCHCWGHCGYICKPENGGGGGGGSTTRKPSPCPHGPIWYNPKGQRCYCQSHNQQPYYVCEATTTTAAAGTTGIAQSTAATTSTTTDGSSTAATTTSTTTAATTAATTASTTTAGTTADTTTTATTTTAAPARRKRAATSTMSTTRKPSPCPHGPIWYNPKGQRCYCQSHNQTPYYVCE